ncbi:hypothetical protein [Vibrio alginolyticus]|uniref:hypothetical protein n=1 Tax=Vibrio alginolyticus TaxID=663 RepID=UPI0035C73848
MKGIQVKKVNGEIQVITEEPTQDAIRAYIDELKERLDTSLYGICPLFNLKPDDNGCRTIRKWYAKGGHHVEMPVQQWRMLLVMVHGFRKIRAKAKKTTPEA